MCRRSAFLAAALLLLFLTACSSRAGAASGIVLSADACFAQMEPGGAAYPIKVTAENTGPSAEGVIEVSEDDYAQSQRVYDYPIDLPSGTVKQLIVYPHLERFASTVDVAFRGRGRAKAIALSVSAFRSSADDSGVRVGMVGDDIGGLAIALPRSSSPSSGGNPNPLGFTDSYCKPEDAPDRAIGYSTLRLLVLGAGAERLDPDQWTAIRQWVIGGGNLLFLGGAGSLAYLQLPGASALCPLQELRESSFGVLNFPLPKKSVSGPALSNVAVVVGSPVPGGAIATSQNDLPILSRRVYGSGMATLAAFNPLEEPLRSSPQDAVITRELLLAGRNGFRVDASLTDGFFSKSAGRASGNPFHISLPPISQIALIFSAYFILVVPVTFFVLRRRGRLEWAWLTTPMLSIAFAFVLYLYSANLYKSGLSRRTAGVVTAASGDPDASFRGYSELFIPRGGSYDIAVPGAERLDQVDLLNGESYGGGPAVGGNASFTTTDTINGVEALGYGVGNLAFRRLYYSQSLRLSGTVEGSVISNGRSLLGQLTNSTPYPLTDVTVYAPLQGLASSVGAIQPGQTVTVTPMTGFMQAGLLTEMREQILQNREIIASLPHALTAGADESAFIIGRVDGSDFGPPIGRDVSGDGSVVYVESIPLGRSRAK